MPKRGFRLRVRRKETLDPQFVGGYALTSFALADVGYFGILEPHFRSWGGAQVFVDLSILALLSCVWMAGDCRTSGVPAWPFIALTFPLGSFGVLFYLLARATVGNPAAGRG